MRQLLIIGLAGWLTACENLREEVEPDGLVVTTSKLAVACFIAPQDTVLTAKVSRSRPLFDDDPTRGVEIHDATVRLSDGKQTVALAYDQQRGYYQADARLLPIRAGGTYHLTVESKEGFRVTASTTVPQTIPLQTLSIDVLSNVGEEPLLRPRISWQDPPEEANFYQVVGLLTNQPTTRTDSLINQPVIFANNALGFFSDSGTEDDQSIAVAGYVANPVGTTLTMQLWHVTEAYYQYHQALALQLQTDGNPFAEPTPIPTNIQNGLGCFGAYNRATITRSLR